LIVDMMTSFSAPEQRISGLTLLRTIIGVDLAYTVHDSGEGSQQADIGLGIATVEALGVGATAIPNPRIENDFPVRGWIYRSRHRIFGFAADQPAVFTVRLEKDLKSRRKLDNGSPYMALENTAIEGVASAIRITGMIRQLWLIT